VYFFNVTTLRRGPSFFISTHNLSFPLVGPAVYVFLVNGMVPLVGRAVDNDVLQAMQEQYTLNYCAMAGTGSFAHLYRGMADIIASSVAVTECTELRAGPNALGCRYYEHIPYVGWYVCTLYYQPWIRTSVFMQVLLPFVSMLLATAIWHLAFSLRYSLWSCRDHYCCRCTHHPLRRALWHVNDLCHRL